VEEEEETEELQEMEDQTERYPEVAEVELETEPTKLGVMVLRDAS
jgi:hypothetical protein